MDETTRAAFERLLTVARADTGQSRRVASFVLAWWNAVHLGGFDVADLFAVDRAIASDMATVFSYVAGQSDAMYPDAYKTDIEDIIRQWRPELWTRAREAA